MGMAMKRKGVVFAEGKKRDRPLNHLAQAAVWITAAFRIEDFEQFGIAIITFGRLKQPLKKTMWRFVGSRVVQVQAKCLEDLSHIALKLAHLLA